MEYAAQLANPRKLVAPLVALVIGAGGAAGAYALIDDSDVGARPTQVIVTEAPAPPSQGVAAKDEARTAASVAGESTAPAPTSQGVAAKDEARTAASVAGGSTPSASGEQDLRSDPHGQKSLRTR